MSISDVKSAVQLATPTRLGFFSCHYNPETDSYSYSPDKSALRYYLSPNCSNGHRINLLEGFSDDNKYGRTPRREMFILRWISENVDPEQENELNCDFICNSLPIESMLEAPFNDENDYEFMAIRVGKRIILDELDTVKRKTGVMRQTERMNAASYSGYKFIECATRSLDKAKLKIGNAGNRDSFFAVCKTQVGAHSLIYSNQVSCITKRNQYDKSVGEMKFVKLATRGIRWSSSPAKLRKWKNRAVKWWAECMVTGTDVIFCGEKTPDQHLIRVISINGECLPQGHCSWSPDVCYQNLDKILSLLKSEVKDEFVVYIIHMKSQEEPVLRRLDEPASKYLPEWFIDNQSSSS